MVNEKRPTQKPPRPGRKGGENRATTEGPDGKTLGPKDPVPDMDSRGDTDPAQKPPESVSKEKMDGLTANQGELKPAETSAIPPTVYLDGNRNSSLEQRKEGEEEKIASEPKPVGILAGKSNTEKAPIVAKNLPSTSDGVAQEDIELQKLMYKNYIVYWRKGGRKKYPKYEEDKRSGPTKGRKQWSPFAGRGCGREQGQGQGRDSSRITHHAPSNEVNLSASIAPKEVTKKNETEIILAKDEDSSSGEETGEKGHKEGEDKAHGAEESKEEDRVDADASKASTGATSANREANEAGGGINGHRFGRGPDRGK